jgi:hypothetical protein
MSSLLRKKLLRLSHESRTTLVLDLVLLYDRGILGLDDAGAALDALGRRPGDFCVSGTVSIV